MSDKVQANVVIGMKLSAKMHVVSDDNNSNENEQLNYCDKESRLLSNQCTLDKRHPVNGPIKNLIANE